MASRIPESLQKRITRILCRCAPVAIALVFTASLCPAPAVETSSPPQTLNAQEESLDFDHSEPSCLMAIHGSLTTERSQRSPSKSAQRSSSKKKLFCLRLEMSQPLTGSVEGSDNSDPLTKMSFRLTESALDRNHKVKVAEKAVQRYRRIHERAIANSKDALDKLICYRGFGPSSLAGDVLLEDKLKLDNLQAAEFVRQKQVDDAHIQTVKVLMQLATGVGTNDSARSKQIIDKGTAELTKLVGEDEARAVVEELKNWSKKVRVSDEVYNQVSWDPLEIEDKQNQVVEAALKNDAVYQKVKEKLSKYNHKGKAMMAASHIVEGSLGIATLAPNIVGPAAQAALTAFEMSTGGPEEAKLIKEIYLYKRLESRARVHSKKAEMALHNYQLGVANKNPLQIAFAQSMISEMSGIDTVQDVFGYNVLDSFVMNKEDASEEKSNN